MAGLEDLAAYLVLGDSQRKAIAAEDPYAGGEQIGQSLLNTVAQARDYDPKERMVAAAISGLAGGLFGGFSDNYQARAERAYQDSIADAITGGGAEMPSVLTPSLWRSAQERGSLFKIQRALSQQELQQKSDLAQAEKITEALADRGFVVGKDGKLVRLFDPNAEAADKAARVKTAELEAENKLYGTDPTQSPKNPAVQARKDDESAIESLRKEFQSKDAFNQFQTVDKGYRAILSAVKDPAGTSDIDLVKGAIQMIEPGMAVNGGEAAAVANTGALVETLKASLLSTLRGESSLSPEVRAGIVRLAARRYGEHARTFNMARDFYANEAKRRNLPEASVTYLPSAAPAEDIAKALGVPSMTKVTTPTANMPITDELRAAAARELERRKMAGGVTTIGSRAPRG